MIPAWGQGILALIFFSGVAAYGEQMRLGLAVTGLHDDAVWGVYIGQFVFLVGIAASAVILVIPSRFLGWKENRAALILGESLAVASLVTALLFVLADLGSPLRLWHALPFLGRLNFPASILAWDLVVLMAYLLLSIFLLLQNHGRWHRGRGMALAVAVVLGLAIHTVTAFLLSGHPARPFWHTGIMAPRFIATALSSGAGLMILLLPRWTGSEQKSLVRTLRWVFGLSLGIDLFLLSSELFVLFYQPTSTHAAAHMVYGGDAGWVSGCMWMGTVLKWGGLVWMGRTWGILAAIIGSWMEKGLGLVVAGMILTPLEEVTHYLPTLTEMRVVLGIWAMGMLLFHFILSYFNSYRNPEHPHNPMEKV